MFLGILFCAALALVATLVGNVQHIMGAPLIGMFLGMILANLFPVLQGKIQAGASFAAKVILRIGIILCGGTLSFATILGAGGKALPFIISSIALAFLTACLVGKYFLKVTPNTRILVAGGTSICGGTAIATLAGVIEAKEDEVGYAMTAIFLFDLLAALIWPYVAMGFGFRPEQFGILAGIAINDVSSVTAAGATYDALMGAAVSASGVTGGELAVVVKLTRVVMLIFVALAVMVWHTANQNKTGSSTAKAGKAKAIAKAFPVFILGFLALAIINTIVDFSSIQIGTTNLASVFKLANKFLITTALVGVGSKMKLKELFTKGLRPVVLGGITWIVVAAVTLCYVIFLV